MDAYSGGRGRSHGLLALLALHAGNEFHRLGWIPPVTAGLVLGNALVYLRPGPLHRLLPSVTAVCFNPHLIFRYGDLRRLFLSAFYHANESHLVYNMMSLVWKGVQLESSLGSVEFASMVAALLGLSQCITLILAKSLLLLDYTEPYYSQYSVGFSGVLFAMKVVLNAHSDDYSSVYGMIVPSRYAAWAELILIQLFVPNVSFLGHLGGIFAGLLYLRVRGSFSGPDPLTALIAGITKIVSWPLKTVRSLFQRPRIIGGGRVGRRDSSPGMSGLWRCSTCTYDNSVWLDVCEMCSAERRGRGFTPVSPSRRSNEPDVEEVRRRRLQRFDR